MAEWKLSQSAPSGWREAASALRIKNVNNPDEVTRIKRWLANRDQTGSTSTSTSTPATPEKALAKALQVKVSQQGDIDIISSPETTPALEGLIALQQTRDNNLARVEERTHEATLAAVQGQTQTTVADLNLQGTRAQATATEIAAKESAGATRFAATEGARSAIQSQNIASRSQERQVGLTGRQARLTQGQLLAGQERQIGATGRQARLTQGQLLAGQERQIGATGRQQRLTQGQLLAGQERQIGLTGEQQRLTETVRGEQERLGIAATGAEQRLTQAQLLSGQERQIRISGAQQRMLTQEQGRQQRETEMQAEMNRRYKEAKDAAQASRAFRA